MTSNPRWKQRPPGSTWGDFGADDQLGRLNLLTPAKVLQGIAEEEGLSQETRQTAAKSAAGLDKRAKAR